MKVILDSDTLKYIKVFQTLTRADVIDCITSEDKILFVVSNSHGLWKSIKQTEMLLKKKVNVIEYTDNVEDFIKKLVPEVVEVQINGKEVRLKVKKYDKPRVIGKEKRNLNLIKKVLNRLFDIEEVKVL